MEFTPQEIKIRKRMCIPLDGTLTLKQIEERAVALSPLTDRYKVGSRAYTRHGPAVVHMLHDMDKQVFLDLKFHDIPQTVYESAQAAAELDVFMFSVHASGTPTMLMAAVEGARKGAKQSGTVQPQVVGVTVLTSIGQSAMNYYMEVPGKVEDHVKHLAEACIHSGLDGIVCSGQELPIIRDHLPPDTMYVTTGIRGAHTPAGEDQRRTCYAYDAIDAGASMLVVGRPITNLPTVEDQLQAGYSIIRDAAKAIRAQE